ncbi:MAG TPA: hypothetical protein QF753_12720 [Victivallales bacterium]|nr:hypothetical protein [Victivallales bacterium]
MYRKYAPKEFEVLLNSIFTITLLILFIVFSLEILIILAFAKSSISINDAYVLNSNLFLCYLSIAVCLNLVILFILALKIFVIKIRSNCMDKDYTICSLIIISVYIIFFQPIYYLKISMLWWTIINVVGAALSIIQLFRIGAYNS